MTIIKFSESLNENIQVVSKLMLSNLIKYGGVDLGYSIKSHLVRKLMDIRKESSESCFLYKDMSSIFIGLVDTDIESFEEIIEGVIFFI